MPEESPLQKAIRLAKEGEKKAQPSSSSSQYKDMSYEDYEAQRTTGSKKKVMDTPVQEPVSAPGGQTTSSPAPLSYGGLLQVNQPTDFNFAQSSNPELYQTELDKDAQQSARLGELNTVYDTAQGEGAAINNLSLANNRQADEFSKPLTAMQSTVNSFKNAAKTLELTIPKLQVASADIWEYALGKEMAKKAYQYMGQDIDKTRTEAFQELDNLSGELKATLGLADSIGGGDVPGMLAGVVNAVSQVGSTAVSSILSGGATLFTDQIGQSITDYNKEKAKQLDISLDDLYKQGLNDFETPAVLGTLAGYLDRVGLKGINNAMTKQFTGTGLKKAALFFTEINKEGVTELLQEGVGAANKSIGAGESAEEAGKKAVSAMFSKQGLEAYLQGLIGSAGVSGAGRMLGFADSNEAKQTISKAIENIGLSEMTLQDPNATPEAKAQAQEVTNQSISSIAEAIDNEDKQTSKEVKSEVQKQDLSETVEAAADATESLTDRLADATTAEEIATIKSEAVQAGNVGIEAAQKLEEQTNKEVATETAAPIRQEGDPVSFKDSQGNEKTGVIKEVLDNGQAIVGISNDGIYSEETITLDKTEEAPFPSIENNPEIAESVQENQIAEDVAQTESPIPQIAPEITPDAAAPVTIENEFDGRPAEDLATMYADEVATPSLSAKDAAIASMPFKINRDSYINFGDRNNITASKARSYFSKDGLSVDQVAQEINNSQFEGREEVTPDDIINFIDTYQNGPSSVTQPSGNPRLQAINDAYFEQTGKKLNQRTAAQIAAAARENIAQVDEQTTTELDPETMNFIEDEGINLENIDQIEDQLGWIFGDQMEAAVVFDNIREYLQDERAHNEGSNPGTVSEGSEQPNNVSGESTASEGQESSTRTDLAENKVIDIDGKETDLEETTPTQDAQVISKAFFNPISEIQKAVDRLENKFTEKLMPKITDAIAEKLKAWRAGKSVAKQMASSFASSVMGGIARTDKDTNMKLGLIGGKNMAVHNMGKIMKSLYGIVNNNTESLERVHVVLDPEFYQNTGQSNMFNPNVPPDLKYADLTDDEKTLYDQVRKNLDDIHFKNHVLGFISKDTFDKHKGTYVPRMYETFELPEEVKEDLDRYQDQVGGKLNLNPFKKKKALDDLSDDSKNAILKDPVYLMAKRMMELDTNSAVMTYINHINRDNKNMVYQGNNPPFNYQKLEGKAYGALDGKYVPSFVAEDLRGYFFVNKSLNNMYDVIKGYDRTWARQAVKKGLTVFNPFVQLGNFTSNVVFAQMSGIDFARWFANTGTAIKSLKAKDQDYEDLLAAGLVGSDTLAKDLRPNTQKANSLVQTAQAKKDQSLIRKVLAPLQKVNDAAMNLYSGNDDYAKINAYQIFKEQGYSKEEALKKVYDGFQNYATVGKFWDVAAKTPVFGNPFQKFSADLARITTNAVTKKPLSTSLYVAGLYMMPQILKEMGISDDDEDDLEKELREGRPFIPKMDLGVVNVPLVYKTKIGELNLARYITPYYFFDNGEDGALSSMASRFNPYKSVVSQGYGKGNESARPFGQDPVLGTLYNIMMDTDFRGKSIQDPEATRFRASGITDEQKWTNRATNALRTWIPNGSLIHDTYLNAKYGEDFYGRSRSIGQTLINFAVKIQDFPDSEYKKTAEKQVYSLVNDVKSQNETIKNTYVNDARKRQRLDESFKEGKISNSDLQNNLDKLDSELEDRILKATKQQAELQKKLVDFTTKYERIIKE